MVVRGGGSPRRPSSAKSRRLALHVAVAHDGLYVPRLCPHSQETQLWKAREARNAFRLNNLKQQVAAVPFFTEVRHSSFLPSTTFSRQLAAIVYMWEIDT